MLPLNRAQPTKLNHQNIEILVSDTPKQTVKTRKNLIIAFVFILIIATVAFVLKAVQSPQAAVTSTASKAPYDCPDNGYFDVPAFKCICNNGYYWDIYNLTCNEINVTGQPWPCPLNAYFNWGLHNCVCNEHFLWDGLYCQASGTVRPDCGENSHFNEEEYKCDCNEGFYYDNGCKPRVLSTSCQEGYTWNGNSCDYDKARSCSSNSHFDWYSDSCLCNVGFSFSENVCKPTFTQTQEAASSGSGSRWGSFTNYDPSTGPGYCDEIVHANTELVVAMHTFQLNELDLCGKYITLYGNGRSVRVKVVDMCNVDHGCLDGTVDGVLAVWQALDMIPGRQDITWSF